MERYQEPNALFIVRIIELILLFFSIYNYHILANLSVFVINLAIEIKYRIWQYTDIPPAHVNIAVVLHL